MADRQARGLIAQALATLTVFACLLMLAPLQQQNPTHAELLKHLVWILIIAKIFVGNLPNEGPFHINCHMLILVIFLDCLAIALLYLLMTGCPGLVADEALLLVWFLPLSGIVSIVFFSWANLQDEVAPPGLPTVTVESFVCGKDANLHTCVVCLEDPEQGAIMGRLQCGHTFHKSCIDQWLQTSRSASSCPYRCQPKDGLPSPQHVAEEARPDENRELEEPSHSRQTPEADQVDDVVEV